MPERLIDTLKDYLLLSQGKDVDIRDIRSYLKIEPGSSDDDNLRKLMSESMVKQKVVRPSGRRDGFYKVVTKVSAVSVFGKQRERRPVFNLFFPRDYDTGEEMDFASSVVVREGDIITVGGVSNFGKTTLALNFCGENISRNPVLMGNEYTTLNGETGEFEPTPRFLNRLDTMSWVNWTNGTGQDRFTLLPVKDDYAEHIVKDKINIIDWVNLDANTLYSISKVMEDIKSEIGRGVGIVVLQKGENAQTARGGQFVKDFTDCEINIDRYTDDESMVTIGKVKEYSRAVIGKQFAFSIEEGVKIVNFREVKKCHGCNGNGKYRNNLCSVCWGRGRVDV